MAHVAAEASNAPNYSKSIQMALIASVTFNVVIGSIFGTAGVLLQPMEKHLGVSTEMASAALLSVIVFSAIFAPQIGSLAVRKSLRAIVGCAAIMLSAAWLILAFTKSYLLYLLAYGILLGPTMAIGGSIIPPTLVTRWFNRNRGLAIGLVHLPILVAALPLVTEWLISHVGLQLTLIALGILPLVTLLPASFFIVDWPPGEEPAPEISGDVNQGVISESATSALSITDLLKRPSYWGLAIAAGLPNTSSMMLGLHLVSMAKSWGISALAAAGLASIMSAVGLIGAILLGMLADRIGGAKTLMVIAVCDAVLWVLFLAGFPYTGLATVVGLLGFFGAGVVPAFSKAFADAFGKESFSRAVGLMVPVTLPILFAGLIGPGTSVRVYGSYTPAVVTMASAFVMAAVFTFAATRSKTAVAVVTVARSSAR